jgi:hypothetical protein
MSTLTFPVELIDDGTGTEFETPQATCACSNVDPETDEGIGSDAFYVFWDHRHNPPHLHIQCFDCEQSYCPYNQCVPPPTAEVYDGEST